MVSEKAKQLAEDAAYTVLFVGSFAAIAIAVIAAALAVLGFVLAAFW